MPVQDYSAAFNTELPPAEEQQFQDWATSNNKLQDLQDYDLRGFWKAGAGTDERGHGTDKFKKPNHPTFSDQSMYHGANGNEGGTWEKLGDQGGEWWAFRPGATNLLHRDPDELRDYFRENEKGNTLITPVDHHPWDASQTPAAAPGAAPQLTPVDHDPWSDDAFQAAAVRLRRPYFDPSNPRGPVQGNARIGGAIQHIAEGMADWARFPGDVAQGKITDPQQIADWGAGTALGMIGGGTPFAKPGTAGITGGRLVQGTRVAFPDAEHAALFEVGRKVSEGEKVPAAEMQHLYDRFKGFVDESDQPFKNATHVREMARDYHNAVAEEAGKGKPFVAGHMVDSEQLPDYQQRTIDDLHERLRNQDVQASQGVQTSPNAVPEPRGSGTLEAGGYGGSYSLGQAQREAAQAAGSAKKLEGLPDKPLTLPNGEQYIPGPLAVAHDAAKDYMREAGLPYKPLRTFQPVDKLRAKRIADEFDRMEHNPDDPRVKASYDAMIKESLGQLRAIERTGLKIEFIRPDMKDPYAGNPRLATRDVRDNNHLWVFPTDTGNLTAEQTFGSAASQVSSHNHPMLGKAGVTLDGRELLNNDVFRIVHDYYGHIKDGNGFRAEGEENAWRSHSSMYSPLARGAMTTETRGQNSWVNYGPHGEKNRTASAADTTYADQKVGLLPDWVMNEGRADSPIQQKRGAYLPPMTPEQALETIPSPTTRVRKEDIESLRGRLREPGGDFELGVGANRDTADTAGKALLASEGRQTQFEPAEQIGHPGRISPRNPTGAKSKENPLTENLQINTEAMKQNPKLFQANVNLVKEYPNMRPADRRGSADRVAENFKDQVKGNLLWIHDSMEPAIRNRSMNWYDGARTFVDRTVDKTGLPDTTVSGIVAALSPQKDWFKNVSLGERVIDVMQNHQNTPYSPEMNARAGLIFNQRKFSPMLRAIRGKEFGELTNPIDQAIWLRLYDEAHVDPGYQILSPEGDFLRPATSKDGTPSRIAWGSIPEISKAVKVFQTGGDREAISALMGGKHKVRSFYNNILDPNAPYGDVTIDTHAVAGGLLRPISGKSREASHNFASWFKGDTEQAKKSKVTGVSGTYGLYADAYRSAAEERGIQPRQMQSVVWEGIRSLFPEDFKQTANVAHIDRIWQTYQSGKISLQEARRLIHDYAGGFKAPEWHHEDIPF